MFVIKFRKIFYTISVVLIATSLYGILAYGLKLGIDFKGGTSIEVTCTKPVDINSTNDILSHQMLEKPLGEFSVRTQGEFGAIVRTRELTPAETTQITQIFTLGDQCSVANVNTVGSILGDEFTTKALKSIFYVVIAIVLFITFAFRGVSKPVSSWKYGVAAVVALLHDIVIPTGVYAFLGHYAGFEVDSLFVTALLVVLGFSVHDTIVVFDRTRENLHKNNKEKSKKTFEEIVGSSVSQTFARSINTSLTTMIALVVLYIYGAEATQHFALTLLIGIAVGTYSSIFIGSPLLVTMDKMQRKRN